MYNNDFEISFFSSEHCQKLLVNIKPGLEIVKLFHCSTQNLDFKTTTPNKDFILTKLMLVIHLTTI